MGQRVHWVNARWLASKTGVSRKDATAVLDAHPRWARFKKRIGANGDPFSYKYTPATANGHPREQLNRNQYNALDAAALASAWNAIVESLRSHVSDRGHSAYLRPTRLLGVTKSTPPRLLLAVPDVAIARQIEVRYTGELHQAAAEYFKSAAVVIDITVEGAS